MIEHLAVLTPDPARSARTRERCRRQLAPRPAWHPLGRAAFAGFCAIYLAAVAVNALRVFLVI